MVDALKSLAGGVKGAVLEVLAGLRAVRRVFIGRQPRRLLDYGNGAFSTGIRAGLLERWQAAR